MFFHNKGETTCMAFDCGTSSMRAAIFTHTGSGSSVRPLVTQIIRVPFEFSGYMDAALLRRNTEKGMAEIARQISPTLRPSEVCVGLSSPFYIIRTSQIRRRRTQHKSYITDQEFKSILDESSIAISHELAAHMSGEEPMILNTTVLSAHINGYQVKRVIGMNGKVLDLRVRFDGTSQEIYNDFKWRLKQMFPTASLRLIPIPIATHATLNELPNRDKSYLLIDMGGEVTELSIVVDGVLERVCSMPLGMSVFIRQIADVLKISFTDALFITRRYADNTLEQSTIDKLSPLKLLFQESIRRRLIRVLEVCAKRIDLPQRIVFTGGGSIPWYQSIVSDEFRKLLAMRKNTTVSLITPVDVSGQFKKQSFSGPSDFGLAAVTLFCAKGNS